MRIFGRILDFVFILADAVARQYEKEQRELDRRHEDRQIQAVRDAYPNGWVPEPPKDSL